MDPRFRGDHVHETGAKHGTRANYPGCFTMRRYGLGAFQPAG